MRITSWTRIKKNRKSAKCLKKTLRGTPIFAAVTFWIRITIMKIHVICRLMTVAVDGQPLLAGCCRNGYIDQLNARWRE